MKKICLFDASGYLFRAYHALPPLTTSKGEPVNAVYGFSRMLTKALNTEKPDYVVVCFDTPGPTFRHEEYEDYKATREEPDDDIVVQIPVAEELVKHWGLPSVRKEGFEADDILATLATKASQSGWKVIIFSGDKDILQLVDRNITVRDEMRKVDYDEDRVIKRFGLKPNQLVDFQALMGDKIDNVIGVPGVGEKTASKLLQSNKNLEGLYIGFRDVKPGILDKLKKFKEQVFKNRRLVELRTDVPVESLDRYKIQKPDLAKLAALVKRLEFRGEFYGLNGEIKDETGKPNKSRKTHTVLTESELSLLEQASQSATRVSYDLETDSSDPHQCHIVGVSLCFQKDEAWYIPVGHHYIGVPKQITWSRVQETLERIMNKNDLLLCGQNLKFDNTILDRNGLKVNGKFFDTMIALYCLESDRSTYGLKDMANSFLNEKMVSFKELVNISKGDTMANVPIENAAGYAGADAEVVWRLVDLFQDKLKKEKVENLFWDLEMPLVKVLQKMERNGIRVDITYIDKVGKKFKQQMVKIEKDIYGLAGEEFNLNSPKQLSRILFEKLKLPVVKKTKTGFSTNEAVLTKLSKDHPICQKILGYRELAKLTSTYIDSLKEMVNPKTSRVHTSFHQTGTSTGRLSSTEPNMQNIPIRSDLGQEIRRAFVASEDCELISADYSQIDLRAMGHMSEDSNLIANFKKGGDIHAATAAEVFHVKVEEVTPEMRQRAKAINFGVVYGQQAWTLSQSLNITVEEAQNFIDKYFERYAGIRDWIDNTLKEAKKVGYVTTLAGRKRTVPDINSKNMQVRGFAERIAINTPIQGTSADIIKSAMIKLQDNFDKESIKTKMMVQVHDELLFDVPKTEIDKVIPMIRTNMEQAIQLKVPLVVDIKTGNNWNDMEKITGFHS